MTRCLNRWSVRGCNPTMGAQLQGTLLTRYDDDRFIAGEMSVFAVFIFHGEQRCHVSMTDVGSTLSARRRYSYSYGVEVVEMQVSVGAITWRGGARNCSWESAPSTCCQGDTAVGERDARHEAGHSHGSHTFSVPISK